MRNDDVRMLLGAMGDFRNARIAKQDRERENQRYAEQQILEQQMRERDEQRYKEQQEFSREFRDWQMRRGDGESARADRADARAQATHNRQAREAAAAQMSRALFPNGIGGARGAAAGGAMFDVEGTIDPETGARAFHSFKGKVPEEYLNSLQKQGDSPELQPQPTGEKKGFLKRLFGGGGAGATPESGAQQYGAALDQAVKNGKMSKEEAMVTYLRQMHGAAQSAGAGR